VFSQKLLDHFQQPRNTGELPPPACSVEVENPACGDILRLTAHFENGRVSEARYKVRGCTASIAAGSALTEWLQGKSRSELAAFDPAVIDHELGGLAPASRHVTVLCADAVKALIKVSF
jgi:nitrogen fixation NifU-like protein